MPNTYSKIYIHLVLVVWGRLSFLHEKYDEDIYSYMSGIISGRGHKSIIINGMPDHIHILLGLKPSEAISDLVRELKKATSKFINERRLVRGKFDWQEGYGAFSYSSGQLENVYNYIANQKEHHKKRNLKDEYLSLLKSMKVEYDEKYLFEFNV